MKELLITRLTPADAQQLSRLMQADEAAYRQYFVPFSSAAADLEQRLESAREDGYWGIWCGGALTGFFMMRGMDEGYLRPSFGVYIGRAHAGQGLSRLALEYCMSWCRLNGIEAMMLKVHPDNRFARRSYENAGFSAIGHCDRTGHTIMEKRWETRA